MVPRDVAESSEEPEMNCNVEIKGQFCWWHVEAIAAIAELGRNSKNIIPGTGEIAQWWTVLDALAENLGLVPDTHVTAND